MISNSNKIIHIESDSQQVKIDFRYTNRHGYGGWVKMNPNCFIRPAGSDLQYTLLETEGITLAPERITFRSDGDILYYSLSFPPIDNEIKLIDIIEKEDDKQAFNFFNIPLTNIPMSISNRKTIIVKKIENLAIELKGNQKEQKSYADEIERLNEPLNELSEFLKITKEETAVFCLALYISITSDSFCINEIKRYSNFNPFDFLK